MLNIEGGTVLRDDDSLSGKQMNIYIYIYPYMYSKEFNILRKKQKTYVFIYSCILTRKRRTKTHRSNALRSAAGLPEAEAVGYCRDIAAALAHIHSLRPKVLAYTRYHINQRNA